MNSIITRLKRYLTYIVFCTFPVMSLVNVAPSLRMNLSLADIFVLLLGIVWLLDIRRFKLKTHFPYAWYFLLFIVILLVSNVFNQYSMVNSAGIVGIISESVKMITNAAFFFVAYNAMNEEDANTKGIFTAWMIGLYIFMLYGLYAFISRLMGINPWSFNQTLGASARFLGTLTDGNAAALYLSVSFFMVLIGKRYVAVSLRSRICLNITNALVCICIGLTMSRGGLVGFLCGLAVWIACNIKTYIRHLYLVPAILCLILFVLFIDTSLFSSSVLRTFSRRVEDASADNGMLQTRINLSLASVRMGVDHPVLGVGRGNFPLNSEPYLMELETNWAGKQGSYRNLVSHNTVAGVFAEMGTVGLCAFLSLFLIGTIKIIKGEHIDRSLKFLFLTLWVSVFVQSLAISLENARVFWLAAGLTFCFADKKVGDCIPLLTSEKSAAPRPLLRCAAAFAGLVLCLFFYAYTGLRYTDRGIDIFNTQLTLTYTAQSAGSHTLRYNVNTPKSDDGTVMDISVVNTETGETVAGVQYTETARGYGNLYFETDDDDSFCIDFSGRASTTVNDVKIIDGNNDVHMLAGAYPLLPQGLYDFSRQRGWLVSAAADAQSKKDFLKTGLLPEDEWVVFGGVIRYKGVNVTQTDDGGTRFDFILEAVAEMEHDFTLWMHIVPDDINLLGEGNRARSYIHGDHRLAVPTNSWPVGEEYIDTHTVYLPKGNWNPQFGFWKPPADEQPQIWLNTDDSRGGVYMGWMTVR